MPRQIIRFYARALGPVLHFLDQEMPPGEIVRRFGRGYGGKPEGGGWYLTVVLESEAAAEKLRHWIAAQPDHSFDGGFWAEPDFDGGRPYSITVDLKTGTARVHLNDRE
jgi:hypothetical protein